MTITRGERRERTLVDQAAAGDPSAWRELYRRHHGRLVVWLASRPTGDAAVAAEDIAADAWLTAARSISDFHGDDDDFAGWLFGVARRVGLNVHRRGQRRQTTPTDEVPEQAPAPGPEPASADLDWALSVLRHLPDREREVLTCMEVLGLDTAGTSQALGISSTAVRVARHRGLRKLRAAPAVVRPA
ncbi:RNA polymerase sigma factor [Nocardioides bruguierae]|uniref:Sigma-70 family RNA polymerase sigma factor n=1 Tax=Nocardioides bruguierae TaxID=2945102 RepID=A0A9X2IEU0_9ACTN|nr:sigma-70 family RNA polymerase sigma factor [Nocardioides bruguierae]MCL8025549.1 sigma-70 family RNA polymerase sigma factor [Nocardioides bruguierae]MCM0620408.1 sigma-70 family RNA polymerase sigma factor [Nocardioides bruguierae]